MLCRDAYLSFICLVSIFGLSLFGVFEALMFDQGARDELNCRGGEEELNCSHLLNGHNPNPVSSSVRQEGDKSPGLD